MKKISLVEIENNFDIKLQEFDIINFEMPEYCTGNYSAVIKSDPDFGLYFDEDQDYFEDCLTFTIIRKGEEL